MRGALATGILLVVLISMMILSERAAAQTSHVGRYSIVASQGNRAGQVTTTNTVWVLDTETGAVSAYAIAGGAGTPFVTIKIAAGQGR